MIGGHLDSWQSATGATDNAVGCAVMMEAARILRAIGVRPRRTIRVALWSGEEQGLLGSQAYIQQHFGTFENPKAGFGKLTAYLNLDHGTGRPRGAVVFGPDSAAAAVRQMLCAAGGPGHRRRRFDPEPCLRNDRPHGVQQRGPDRHRFRAGSDRVTTATPTTRTWIPTSASWKPTRAPRRLWSPLRPISLRCAKRRSRDSSGPSSRPASRPRIRRMEGSARRQSPLADRTVRTLHRNGRRFCCELLRHSGRKEHCDRSEPGRGLNGSVTVSGSSIRKIGDIEASEKQSRHFRPFSRSDKGHGTCYSACHVVFDLCSFT